MGHPGVKAFMIFEKEEFGSHHILVLKFLMHALQGIEFPFFFTRKNKSLCAEYYTGNKNSESFLKPERLTNGGLAGDHFWHPQGLH